MKNVRLSKNRSWFLIWLLLLSAAAIAGLTWKSALAQRWGSVNVAADGMMIMAGALGLDGQPGWNYYNSGDAPQGAYMGWLRSGTGVITATVKLPKPLTPGPHYIFFYGIDYDNKKSISASVGGATSGFVALDDRDATGQWSERAVL